MKKGPFTKKEKSYLTRYKHLEVSKLAKKLDRDEKSVMAFLGLSPKKEEPPKEPKKDSYLNDLFAKKEERSVVVMTEAASSYLDSKRGSTKKNYDSSFIHVFDKNKRVL